MDPVLGAIIVANIAGIFSILNTIMLKRQNVKIDETHTQVTTNHHSSDPPTVLDRLDTLTRMVARIDKRVTKLEKK